MKEYRTQQRKNSFRHYATAVLLLFSASAVAQTAAVADTAAAQQTFWMKLPNYIENPLLWYFAGMSFILLLVFYTLSRSIIALSRQLHGVTEPETMVAAETVRKKSAWSGLMKILTRSVPVEQEEDVMLDHNYDGIRELDNKLPPWWVWGFYITIIFAVVYLFYYHLSGVGKSSAQEYEAAMTEAQHEKDEYAKHAADYVTDASVVAFTDAHELEEGKTIFMKNCIACHGNAGQGGVGPNLTDDYWLHGGGIKNVFHTISEGVPAKGMISWKNQLSPKQRQEVGSFILTLHGTNPAGAKEPQGDLWTEQAKTDTTAASPKM